MNRILIFIFGLILGVSATGVLGYFYAKVTIDVLLWGTQLTLATNAEQGLRHIKLLEEGEYQRLGVILESKVKTDAESLLMNILLNDGEPDSYAQKVFALVEDAGIEINTELPDFSALNHK